jgi:2-polyprenyl-3-methyl-5-hydroxy-6-metoxy-1,4-benzoquinol methylase
MKTTYLASPKRPDGYRYEDANHTAAHGYLLPPVERILSTLELPVEGRRIFELGCGNGFVANWLNSLGYEVVGVDPSVEGIAQAASSFPHVRLESGSCYDDLAGKYGVFSVVLSLEVVEHVFLPRLFAKAVFDLLQPGGVAIISTPFHGYWKNVALAMSGKMDAHFTALWDYGHIKFWSFKTLSFLLREAGFHEITFARVGRLPPLAKAMIAVARKP